MPDIAHRPDRIEVVPATAEHLRALIDGTFEDRFALTVAEGYLEFDGVLEYALDVVTEQGGDPAWQSHLFVHTTDRCLIGLGGFKGAPVDGVVEIGYGIAPAYRRQGFAAEASRIMVERASAAGVERVIAHTLAETNPSTRVLARLGFVQTATIEDPEDGPVWRWSSGSWPVAGEEALRRR